MAKKTNRKRRRKPRTPAPEADPTGGSGPDDGEPVSAGGEGRTRERPARRSKPKSRLGAAIDRMEQAAVERPPAPWGNFPLAPLSVLAGLVLIVIGAISTNPVQLTIGVCLGALGGLELSIREHFSGFRSHTTLLAGFTFVIVVGLSFYVAKIVLWACLLIGLIVAIPTFWLLRKRFEKASGGLSYKIR